MIQWKSMFDETGGAPARRRMARLAIRSELPAVDRRIRVTLHTLARRAAKTIMDVALVARHSRVLAFKRIDRRVIESL